MKKVIIAICFIFIAQNVFAVEIVEGKPDRKYSVLSPISSNKANSEKAFLDVKNKAEKMGADAIINWSCDAGEAVNRGLLKIRFGGVSAKCEGTAIKWK